MLWQTSTFLKQIACKAQAKSLLPQALQLNV